VRYLVKRHRAEDEASGEPRQREKQQRTIENLQAKAKKIRSWLNENKDGHRGASVREHPQHAGNGSVYPACREKVNTQWKLFCLVHNIEKLSRYATLN
jgi:hypothetical protein